MSDDRTFLTWENLPRDRAEAAEKAARDVITRLDGYAIFDGKPLSDWDHWVLRHGVSDMVAQVENYIAEGRTASEAAHFEQQRLAAFGATLNRTVLLIRSAIVRDNRAGMQPRVEPRKGLLIPVWWNERYELIYTSEMPWTISTAFQSALLGHPPFGELVAWRSI